MSQLDELLRYTGAVLLRAHNANDEAEKRALVDVAHVLALAALDDASTLTAGERSGHDASAA